MAKRVKQDVIEYVRQKFGITEPEAEAYVEATIEGITKFAKDGDELHIKNFARWKTVRVKERAYRKIQKVANGDGTFSLIEVGKVVKPEHTKISCKNLINPEK